jgi:hypothetical protein
MSRALHAAEAAASKAEQARLGALMRMTAFGPEVSLLSRSDPKRRQFDEAAALMVRADMEATKAREQLARVRTATAPKPNAKALRAELKAAISVAKRMATVAANGRAAIERSGELVSAAERKLTDANAGLDRARETDARAAAKVAAGGTPVRASAMAKARARVTEMQDAVDAAKGAAALATKKQTDLDRAAALAQRAVEIAADTVLKTSVPVGLVEEAAKMQAEFVHRRIILRELAGAGLLDQPVKDAVLALLRQELPGAPDAVQFQDWRQHPAAQQWEAMRSALRADADTLVAF